MNEGMLLTYHPNVTEQHGALRINAQSFFEVNFCQVELLLFVVDHSQTIPVEKIHLYVYH